jgi:hypothetical protein
MLHKQPQKVQKVKKHLREKKILLKIMTAGSHLLEL